jgi:hypothetical protein
MTGYDYQEKTGTYPWSTVTQIFRNVYPVAVLLDNLTVCHVADK